MVKVFVKKENSNIKEILFKGHALYSDYGKDIVCAAISSIVITTINKSFRKEINSSFFRKFITI